MPKSNKNRIRSKDIPGYSVYTTIGLFIPIIGLILGAVAISKNTAMDRKLGVDTIASSIFGAILWSVLVVIILSVQANQAEEQLRKDIEIIEQMYR